MARTVRKLPQQASIEITITIDPERTMTPQQQAAWDWFVQEVHRRLAHDQQPTDGLSQQDSTP